MTKTVPIYLIFRRYDVIVRIVWNIDSYVYLMTKWLTTQLHKRFRRKRSDTRNFRFCAGNREPALSPVACKASLTPSIRMILPEQELVVKYSSQLLSRATTCLMSSSTLPFLLRSSLFRHCFFHWLNIFSIASRFVTDVTEAPSSDGAIRRQKAWRRTETREAALKLYNMLHFTHQLIS